MSRHRMKVGEGGGANPPPGGRKRLRGPAVVAVACSVLLAGAGAGWALSRPDGPDQTVDPDGTAGALPSAGYVEGFGQASPALSPTRRPPVRVSPTARSSSSSPVPIEVAGENVSATYRISAWQGAYKVEFLLVNSSEAAVTWSVRIQLPAGARVQQYWNAELDEGDVLTFRPPRWDNGNPRLLSAGGQHDFGFIVQQPSGQPGLVSCAIDGHPCRVAD